MRQDIIIIGAGIIGLASAERLLTQGASVTILERNKVGQESSWAGGGILSPLLPWSYPNAVTQLTGYSNKLFPTWTSGLMKNTGIDPEYDKSGMLILPPFQINIANDWCAAHGMKIEHTIVPITRINEENAELAGKKIDDHALYLPDIAQVRNPRLLRALYSRITQLGGKIIENCNVYPLNTKSQQVTSIKTSCGEFKADHFIVSTGAWSKETLGTHALKLDIKPIRGQMLLYKFDTPPINHIVAREDFYIIPRKDGHILIGSTLEDVGFNKHTTSAAFEYLIGNAREILPILHQMPVKQHWSGLRPASPQNIPTIGRHPRIRNLLVSCGHFRYGVTMAPGSAEILVNELTGTAQPFDTAFYQAGWNDP
ncbi:glycine oxidase ThiO [Nitrosomonas sp.]|uniref:glycine oxidase ThiO n=1 Tax=Nitrosomonas sp. TaxID=42353 RepID=UPI001E02549F|nr:glycine oxidase ThiO [Nitrosomonas sp.]MBX3617984.1 glycine oxidase ThiO [Nitrosomonas sp.]